MIKFTTTKTVETEDEHEVKDGTYYFYSEDEGREPDFYFKLNVKQHPKLSSLSEIEIEKVGVQEDRLSIVKIKETDSNLPYYLQKLFSGAEKRTDITKEQFYEIKNQIIDRLKL